MADPKRTARVAAKARQAIMKNVQYVPHKDPDAQPGSADDTAAAMSQLDKPDPGVPEKKLHQDLPMEMDLSDAAADKAPGNRAAKSKTVRSLMGAYKQSK